MSIPSSGSSTPPQRLESFVLRGHALQSTGRAAEGPPWPGRPRSVAGQANLFTALAREEMDAVHEAHPVAPRAHDQRVRACAVGQEADAAREVAVETPVAAKMMFPRTRSSRRKTRSTSSTPKTAGPAGSPGGPWARAPRLQLAAEAAQRSRREHRLSGSPDPDREVVVRAADCRGDRRRHRPVLDELDPRSRAPELLDQVVMTRAVWHDDRDVVRRAAERFGDRSHVLGDGWSRSMLPRARGPTALPACTCPAASSATRARPRRPPPSLPAPRARRSPTSSGSRARSTSSPPAARVPADRRRALLVGSPDHDPSGHRQPREGVPHA